MKRIVLAAAISAALSSSAVAQQPPFPTDQERKLIMEMCETAYWAARRQFDGMCAYLTVRFEAVERAAREKAEADKPKPPADQPPADVIPQDKPKENP